MLRLRLLYAIVALFGRLFSFLLSRCASCRKRVPLELGPLTLPFSVRLGYTASSNNFPFYTYAVADKSLFFEQT